MKPSEETIKNLSVARSSEYSNWVVSCEFEGYRYHFWLKRDDKEPSKPPTLLDLQPQLYKNQLTPNHPDSYLRTRKLDPHSKSFGEPLITTMFRLATERDLFNKANVALEEDLQEQKRISEANIVLQKKKEAAEAMYDALVLALDALEASRPKMSQYPEPVKRHADTIAKVKEALALANGLAEASNEAMQIVNNA